MDVGFGKVCNVFGFKTLNEHQKNALKFVIEKKKNVFVNQPTGFHKSVIFQTLPLNSEFPQIVNSPRRGERGLDLVLANLQDHYETSNQRPPLGLSDHMSIEVQPKVISGC